MNKIINSVSRIVLDRREKRERTEKLETKKLGAIQLD